MKKQILAIFVILLLGIGYLGTIPQGVDSESSGRIVVRFRNWASLEVLIDNTSDTAQSPLGSTAFRIKNVSTQQTRYIIHFGSLDLNSSEIYKVEFTLFAPAQSVPNAGNISVHALSYQKGAWLNVTETNWTNAKTSQVWNNEGGDYNSTPLDTIYIDDAEVGGSGTGFHFNITTYALKPEQLNQVGLIFIAEDDCDIYFEGTYAYSNLKIYYTGGSGETTPIYQDVWNLEGFANSTSKLASTIYSEIDNCTALSWKNDVSGYWYTYWPSLGLVEDAYLEFGDGLFILTDQDTTWDHT